MTVLQNFVAKIAEETIVRILKRIIAYKSVSTGSLITSLLVKRFTYNLRLFLAFYGSELVDLGLH